MNGLVEYAQLLINFLERNGDRISIENQHALGGMLENILAIIDEQQLPQETQAPEVPIGTELLWMLAGGNPEAFANYLQTIPDPEMNALLSNPGQLNNIISHLEQSLPQNRNASQDGIPQAELQSSNIYGFQYDPKTKKLMVRFQEGNVYEYEGVPEQVFNIFSKGAIPAKTNGSNKYGAWYQGKIPSLGAAFYELIKQGGYPYQKLK